MVTVALSDGTVLNVPVKRHCSSDGAGRVVVSLQVQEPEVIPDTDKRTVTMLQWIEVCLPP